MISTLVIFSIDFGKGWTKTGAAAACLNFRVDAAKVNWSRVIGPGESLDVLLAGAGLAATVRAEISPAIGSEYDLRRLQPGYRLSLQIAPDGTPSSAMLDVEAGLRVHAAFGANPSVRRIPPELEIVVCAGEAKIGGSARGLLHQPLGHCLRARGE